jgi:drug/metabolite transporter (DMT)-like permease
MRIGRAGSQTVMDTRQVRAPWAVLAVTVALVVFKLWLVGPVRGRLALDHSWVEELMFQILPVPFAVVGALIAARRPGHRIGWLLLIGTLSIASAQFAWTYALYKPDGRGLASRPRGHRVGGQLDPLAGLAAFMLLLLWFPDGEPPSPRWHPIGWTIVAYCTVIVAFLALYPALISAPELDNPFALSGAAGTVMRKLQASPVVPALSTVLFLRRRARRLSASAAPEPPSASS